MSSPQSRSGKLYNVAVVGATGMVGTAFLKIAAERAFPVKQLKLLATERSAGKRIAFGESEITVESTTTDALKGADFVFVSASDEASREYCAWARENGAIAIDDSGVWRQEPDVPLVIPEVNADDVDGHKGILAIPNCSTTPHGDVPLAAAQAESPYARHRRHVPVGVGHRYGSGRRTRGAGARLGAGRRVGAERLSAADRLQCPAARRARGRTRATPARRRR